MTSTLSLVNARARDTGDFGCRGIPYGFANTFTVNQYVYVFSSLILLIIKKTTGTDCHFFNYVFLDDTELVIVEANEYYFDIPLGKTNYPINCKSNNPDVNVSLIYQQKFTARAKNLSETKVTHF
jgi:hypothetical protein